MSERVPPHDLDAEAAVLGSCILSPEAFATAAPEVTTEDFYDPRHRSVWEAICALSSRGRHFDVLELKDTLKSHGLAQNLDLVAIAESAPVANNVTHYARIVRGKADLRRLIAFSADLQLRAYSAAAREVGDLVDEASAAITSIATKRADEAAAIGDLAPAVADAIEARTMAKMAGETIGFTFGIDILDNTLGSVLPGDQVVIAGRPGGGKTALALQGLVEAVSQHGATGLMYSLEMSRHSLVERVLVRTAKVNSQAVGRGDVSLDEMKRIHRAAMCLRRNGASIPAFVDDRSRTLVEYVARARRWRAKFPPPQLAVFAVDYVQLTRLSRGRGETKAEAIGYVTNELKHLAKEIEAVALICAQLNRSSVELEAPRIESLKDSGDIEQSADTILMLHNPHKQEDGEVECIIGKNRRGPLKTVPLHWTGRHYAFRDPGYEQQTNWQDGDDR